MKFSYYIVIFACLIISTTSCSQDSDELSSLDTSAQIKNLKSHKWYSGGTVLDIDVDNLYAQLDKDSRLIYFLTDTTGVSIYKSSSEGTDGYSSNKIEYLYFRYKIDDGKVRLSNENSTGLSFVYHDTYLEGRNGDSNLKPLPLSNDAEFIKKHSELAHVHLLSEYERLENIGKVEVSLLNAGALSSSTNFFNVNFVVSGENYLYERQFSSLKLYITCSTYLHDRVTSETKIYDITDNEKISKVETYMIQTSRSEVTLKASLSVYDEKSMKRYFLVDSKEVTFNKDGTVDEGSSGSNDDGTDSGNDTDDEKLSFTVGGVSFNMIPVQAGTFQMGSTSGMDYEKPVHSVTISQDYYIGETEVTQSLWKAVTGYSPTSDGSAWSSTYGIGDNFPAYYISYDDVQRFLNKLNNITGQHFRMPTEAEWEYAARGGNKSQGYTYSGSNKNGDVAWYKSNSSKAHAVKTKTANELGIYDMSGNVWEWCSDWYDSNYYSSSPSTDPTGPSTGTHRINRGGSWHMNAANCRTTRRLRNNPSGRGYFIGFRLAL